MAQYRKKPVVVEAIQFDGTNHHEIVRFTDDRVGGRDYAVGSGQNWLEIHTLEGTMRADVGDWIIRGVKGEFYPCKPDVFEATYDKV